MAQKTQNASSFDDQLPTSASSSAKDSTRPASTSASASAPAPATTASASASTSASAPAAAASSSSGSSSAPSSRLTELDVALRPTAASMTKPAADLVPKDAGLETASPYGTRSRNRTGSSRPNYAEDKDVDVDMFDYYPDKKEPEPKKAVRQAHHAAATASTTSNGNGNGNGGSVGSSNNGSSNSSSSSGGGNSGGNSNNNGNGNGNSSSSSSSSSSVANDGQRSNGPSRGQKDEGSASQRSLGASTNGPRDRDRDAAPAAASGAPPVPSTSATQASTVPPASKKRKAGSQSTAAPPPPRRGATSSQAGYGESNMLTFADCNGRPKDGMLIADDGTTLHPNDHVYLVCEPPGEPYYLARIMEFLHVGNDPAKPIDALRVNWYYRPKDIGRKANDTRLVFATMHSDISPLTSLRGKCTILHKSEIKNLDEYRKNPDSFWFEKLYDRYIQKNYDLIPTSTIVNVPEKVKKVLHERWKYILVEQGRGKEFTGAVKLCKRCTGYCASNDSVDCAVCQNTYHMNCVKPPLLKKPSRGFAWSCAACSRAQERKLEARNTPNVLDAGADGDEEELYDDDDDEMHGVDTGRTSPDHATNETQHAGTAEQIYQASLWPYRYLGMHCKVEDALDYDDRIYPRASSRIGPRHQANVLSWPGRPVEYVKAFEIRRAGKNQPKLSKEAQAALEAEKAKREKRPKWVQDEPPGYVPRGEDYDDDNPNCTATLLWKPPPEGTVTDEELADYMKKAKDLAPALGLPEKSTNLDDVAVETLFHSGYNPKRALKLLSETDKSVFNEPELTPTEIKKFEEGVAKFGSELHSVKKHVKSVPHGQIVRFYYTWKKTDRGKQIWGNYAGRKGKKEAKKAEAAASKLQDDVADDHDDSAFDGEKAIEKKKCFICKFCSTKTSRQWRRAPTASSTLVTESSAKTNSKDKNGPYIQALCRRCAELWRRYAIQWEDIDEVAKKVAQAGGRAWKRRQDEELLKELKAAKEIVSQMNLPEPDLLPADTPPPATNGQHPGEPPRKKLKGAPPDRDDQNASDSGSALGGPPSRKKEKAADKHPPAQEMPKPRTLPCAVCGQMEPMGDQHLSCKECRLTVHRNCYGVSDVRNPGKWVCDMCVNDKSTHVSLQYKCVLCPVEKTEHDFVEPPKVSTSKKKTEKDREREKQDREAAIKVAEYYRRKQEEHNRPVDPREPLKRTADNNWIHVTCAVWTPEVKFGNAKALSPSEGVPSIPREKYEQVCAACNTTGGACVSCHHCKLPVHVECARQNGYLLGFDITPVKGSRRDQFSIVAIGGESGTMSAAIWCKDHVPTKTIVHPMHDPVADSGMNALQLYVQNFKKADLTLTGTVRKSTLITTAAKTTGTPTNSGLRRASTTTLPVNGTYHHEVSVQSDGAVKICAACGVDTSPIWHDFEDTDEKVLTNGHGGKLSLDARLFLVQRKQRCHKCHHTNRRPNSRLPLRAPTPPPPPPPAQPVAMEPQDHRASSQPVAPPPVVAPPPPATSPPHHLPENRRNNMAPYSWSGPAQAPPPPPVPAAVLAPQIPAAPPPVAPPPLPASHPPHVAHQAHQAHAYPPTHRSPYEDWRAATPHGSPPTHQVNGVPPAMQPSALNLGALRPPPMAIPPHPAPMPTSLPNGHLGQPMLNGGLPPSPRRVTGPPPLPNTAPYIHSYHHSQHHAPPVHHNMTNGGGPLPPRGPEPFSSSLLPHRSTFSTPHGSPPASRDGLPLSRDGPLSHHASTQRPPENRPSSSASSNPSLRNLLS